MGDIVTVCKNKENYVSLIQDKVCRRITKQVGQAIGDFDLIEEGDRIAVGVSGGKDSYSLLHVLEEMRRRAPVDYELVALNVDAGFPEYQSEVIEAHLKDHGFTTHVEKTNCREIIEEKCSPGKSYCSFCARLRRGVLYTVAEQLGCNKIALGHHLDDFIETLLLNQFYSGKIAAMSPKLKADNGIHTVIRPFVYVEEEDIIQFTEANEFPVVSCGCPVVEEDQKRQKMKALIGGLAAENPHLKRNMLKSLANVQPRHLLDKGLKVD